MSEATTLTDPRAQDATMLHVLRTARRTGLRFVLDTTQTPPQVRITAATKHLLTHVLHSDLQRHKVAISVRLLWEQGMQQYWRAVPCAACGSVDWGVVRHEGTTPIAGCLTCTEEVPYASL